MDRDELLRCLPSNRELFYGGRWHSPISGLYEQTIDPATGASLGDVAEGGTSDVAAAVSAAHAGFLVWAKLKPSERGSIMREAASILRRHAEEFALIDALDTGNPVAQMIADAHIAAASIDYFAGLAGELKGQTIPLGNGNLNYTLREPLGVVARIVAYNHPLMFAGTKIGAPLAAGNSLIIKAAAQAPLSALRLAELIGGLFPDGVLNVVTGGVECGRALAEHTGIAAVSLIGSIPTGRAVMRSASETLKPVILELGGKNALIAYPDADCDAVADGAVRGMNFTWAGQSCGSTSRLFLHSDIHDQVLEKIVRLTRDRHRPGLPTDHATTMGPLVSKAQHDKVLEFIAKGKEQGARLVTGGEVPNDPALASGWFVEPTVFADVTSQMAIAREEIFGPVLSVIRWSDENTLFEQVNELDYGLTAAIFTRDLNTAHLAAQRVQAGYVWINNVSEHFPGAPFGGYKQSGLGREESLEEMYEFSQLKNVNIKF
ncbi:MULTISPECIES: aldehyde dehydrogenase family protein [Alphaproteobacteria]|jgi:betaine-aldehyde dehydrogenase|uniref:Aldehyde dehydrogenase n=1 Tax=Novosphingobium guangzhouense TaxID=1850347 RepID=A0A2K2FWJ1_9SPHN|nr:MULTISPECIES: aldehyde dehydrogenase family protein [Sphingomonadaceae]PNU03156.1 aldehyde dehydrogenase [Novosphingobium guangzhouense]